MITRTCFICGDKHHITKIATIGKGKNIKYICFGCVEGTSKAKVRTIERVEDLDNMDYGR